MNGWTSQTDRAFYQMQYLTGHETDEMKMVLGNSEITVLDFGVYWNSWNFKVKVGSL